MSIRQKVKVRGGAAVVLAAVLALMLAGCGGGDKPKEQEKAGSSQGQATASQQSTPSAPKSGAPLGVIATAAGPAGVVLEINSAVRDQDGYITVSGQIRNGGSTTFSQIAALRGDEQNASPASVAGASLVDSAGKKRYLVLRDTEGRCACTTGLTFLKSGESVPIFAQFPAPPATTTEVVFGLPTFAATPIKISG
uniref:Secreted protein n=1 Tax=Streptomyces sp. NBC_00049 TaxID=2903617 RepID=A0AAU2JVK5_9ACTN